MATKKKVTDLQTVETLDNADVLHIVDVSDHSQHADGSSRKTTIGAIVNKVIDGFTSLLSNKVDKITGKGLSTEDYTSQEKNKLAGIETGAEVNVNADWNSESGKSRILNKPNIPVKLSDLTKDINFDERYYTETEIDTKTTDIQSQLDDKADSVSISAVLDLKINNSEKGSNNGVATLDSGGKVPVSQLPATIMEYKGSWNPSTNTPHLQDGVGNTGDIYMASVKATINLGSGNISFGIGDWVVYNGSIWEKSLNSSEVMSVNGQQGDVVLDKEDIGLSNVDNTSDLNKPISNATQSVLNNKADIDHIHDDRYYTKTEIDTQISNIDDVLQNNIDTLQNEINGKSDKLTLLSINTSTDISSNQDIRADASNGDITLNATSNNPGDIIIIKKVDSSDNSVFIYSDSLIDGDTIAELSMQDECITIRWTGANYDII